ncbi:MAG: hypothetical protein GY910_06035 [bacterium]|nr:hypothetical protein [Deltaproteobacteria bacterium]MCP4904520.1 hypothetical protein [bacterium]
MTVLNLLFTDARREPIGATGNRHHPPNSPRGETGLGYAARRPRAVPLRGDPTLTDPASGQASTTPWLLLAGAAIGLGVAAFGLLERRGDASALPPEAAAVVGERTIRRIDYRRVLAGVEGDLRSPIDEAMRRRVLDRMIDEELLVQRALGLGLAGIDRRVRGELTSGLIDSIVSEVDAEEPSDGEVSRHYAENVDFFTRPGRLRVRAIFFSARRDGSDPRGNARERAEGALVQLRAGDPPSEVEARSGDPQVSPVPDTLLPASKVRDYLGPRILDHVADLASGTWSEPISSGSGIYLATPFEREAPVVPRLDEIEPLVRQDLKRRRGDDALREYLSALRAQTPVAVDESLFEATRDEP